MVDDDSSTPPLTVVEVHDRHADFVWRTLQRLGVSDADLDDAMQEVFVVVHKKLGAFRRDARITTWLYGISLRVAVALRRRAHRRHEEPAAEPEAGKATDPERDPEALAIQREGRQRLAAVLDAMDPEKRVVLVMSEVERMDTASIADELGIPLGTVYSRLHAARAQFARAAARHRRQERT
jgi:RNA polymerase sigma-70 factor (ECF subfamily)